MIRARRFLAAILLLCAPLSTRAAEQPSEYQVKAVFLLNFVKFIEWPASAFARADSPVTICIWGKDPFGETLDRTMAGEVVNGRRVVATRITRAPSPRSCQVLFLETWEKEAAKAVSGLGPGVLTVGEGRDFLRNSGMIAFSVEDRRVRFDINRTAAERASLKLSSKLLSVARNVEQ
ncbi:MAG TPA: YfiR family protein [Bryobacteraceae bacterium]